MLTHSADVVVVSPASVVVIEVVDSVVEVGVSCIQ